MKSWSLEFNLNGSEFFLRDHVIANRKILPAVVYLELVFEAARQELGKIPGSVKDLTLHQPITSSDWPMKVQITFSHSNEEIDFEIATFASKEKKKKRIHATGQLSFVKQLPPEIEKGSIEKSLNHEISHSEIYMKFQAMGFEYGPSFRTIDRIQKGDKKVLGQISIKNQDECSGFLLPPPIMDGAFQTLIGFEGSEEDDSVPYRLQAFALYASIPYEVYSYCKPSQGSEGQSFDIQLIDHFGKVVAEFRGLQLKSLGGRQKPKNISVISSEKKENKDQLVDYLKGIISQETKIPISELSETLDFDQFGIDSFMAINLSTILERDFGELSKTLFYEYQSILDLAEYFFENHLETVKEKFPFSFSEEKEEEMILKVPEISEVTKPRPFSLSKKNEGSSEIAIIGLSGRYPKARNLEEFWENLQKGKNCITEIPTSRWNHSSFFSEKRGVIGKTYSKWGGFIEDVDKFDPLFFHISYQEAETMDPQERLILEVSWEALEDAGYNPKEFGNHFNHQVGVFVGGIYLEYQLYAAEQTILGHPTIASGSLANISNRVSYFYNFRGPSISLDTMCSSSLTAFHMACKSLEEGEVQAALVGGVNLTLHPNKYLLLGSQQFLSSEGLCRTLGEGGDGYVPAEGVGVALLKKLDQAIEDRDHIYGVIKGSAINHGGKVSGYTVPNPNAQSDVIEKAVNNAGVSYDDISYLELHGTGTSLGDPIEIAGLSKAFKNKRAIADSCRVGSVKSNIGHAEAAAGMAGLTKVLLQMKYHQLVPSLHAEQINEKINLEKTPFALQKKSERWGGESTSSPLIAGISSFGAGGSNAHLIIEEYPQKFLEENEELQLIPLSARSEDELKEMAFNLLNFLKKKTDLGEGKQAFLKTFIETVARTLDLPSEKVATNIPLSDLGIGISEAVKIHRQLESQLQVPIDFEYFQHNDSTETIVSKLTHEEDKEADPTLTLANLAYTLQAGRKQMKYRLAFLAKEIKDVIHNLELFLEGKREETLFFSDDSAYRDKDLYENEEFQELIQKWFYSKKYLQIAKLWARGIDFDWSKISRSQNIQRISLPTYPFKKERIWLNLVSHPLSAAISHEEEEVPIMVHSGVDLIRELISEETNIPLEKLGKETSFEEIGLDSISINRLARRFQDHFGEVETTLLFKYRNIKELGQFFDSKFSQLSEGITLKKKREKISAKPKQDHDIAIIGVSGRFPQTETLEEFWENLQSTHDCIEEVPHDRWDYHKFYSKEKGEFGKTNCKWGGFLKDVYDFDPLFFNISPDDARFMDPQERLFLEEAWKCLERAGYSPKEISQVDPLRRVGVFAGVSFNNYQLIGADAFQNPSGAYPANSQTFSISNRVSYILDLRGPSLSLDTACSSSLYALHLACESLKRGECKMALAGGVNLTLHPSKYVSLSMSGFSASDGRCHSFADGGDGYVPGEGVGVVFLKPLKSAIEDGDQILGVIKGSGVSHDGRTHGYTVPSPQSQSAAIEAALDVANLSPETISYIEAHGTGTPLGDPIEIEGLTDVYEQHTDQKQYCFIGSVKSNIGHLEAAAGIAQIIKVLLQFEKQMIVANVMHSQQNQKIKFEKTPFKLALEKQNWERKEAIPRRAGVSSFGAGGVNVHMILEEAPQKAASECKIHPEGEPIFLSAKNKKGLEKMALNLRDALIKNPDLSLADISYTLCFGREWMKNRYGKLVRSKEKLLDLLSNFDPTSEDLENLEKSARGREVLKWTKGEVIDPHLFFTKRKPKRVVLPTYPFEKQFYSIKDWAKEEGSSLQKTQYLEKLNIFSEVDQINFIQSYLQEKIAKLLGFPEELEVDIDQGFFEMGMESIQGVQLQKDLEKDFLVKAPDTAAFDYPNIRLFSEYFLTLVSQKSISKSIEEPFEAGNQELVEALNKELLELGIN